MGHIVVIDDCQLTLAMVGDFLADAGFKVATSSCPVYSNHLIYGPGAPDLIVLDVMMPLMRGDKKLRAIKSREKSRNIPVLLISSKGEAELQALAEDAGADGYLTKPFTAERLVKVVKNLMGR